MGKGTKLTLAARNTCRRGRHGRKDRAAALLSQHRPCSRQLNSRNAGHRSRPRHTATTTKTSIPASHKLPSNSSGCSRHRCRPTGRTCTTTSVSSVALAPGAPEPNRTGPTSPPSLRGASTPDGTLPPCPPTKVVRAHHLVDRYGPRSSSVRTCSSTATPTSSFRRAAWVAPRATVAVAAVAAAA